MSGTRHAMASATTNVTTASATNTMRQCVTRSASSSGTVAASAPMPPATIIHPAYDACRSRGYHALIAFSGAMRHADTPAPMIARATARLASDSASANSVAPSAASVSSTGSTRRGPKRSSRMPTGTCIAANARKYALVSSPSADGLSPRSRTSSGEITALTVRYRYDSRYPAANAK